MKTFLKILFVPLVWLAHACSPLGEPVDEKKSDNHYYNSSKTDINYSPMGNWFELGNSPMNADVESFGVLSRFLSRDKNRAYFQKHPIEDSTLDLESLYTKEGDYMTNLAFDKAHVYYFEDIYQAKNYAKALKIQGADPKTYLRNNWDWAKDDQNHFYRHQGVPVDYNSFENLNDYFSKDKDRAYHHYGKNFTPMTADVGTFKVIAETRNAVDRNKVYCLSFPGSEKDQDRLVTIPLEIGDTVDHMNGLYLKVGNGIYYNGLIIEDADAESFEIVQHHYAKDKNSVYLRGKTIPEADAATFGILKQGGVGDKDGPFRNGKRFDKPQ